MLEIKNLQFQPLTLHLKGEQTLHLGPRERQSIAESALSTEAQTAQKRGLITITTLPENVPQSTESGSADESSEAANSKRRK